MGLVCVCAGFVVAFVAVAEEYFCAYGLVAAEEDEDDDDDDDADAEEDELK